MQLYEVSGIFDVEVAAETEADAKNEAIRILTGKGIPHHVMEVKKMIDRGAGDQEPQGVSK